MIVNLDRNRWAKLKDDKGLVFLFFCQQASKYVIRDSV